MTNRVSGFPVLALLLLALLLGSLGLAQDAKSDSAADFDWQQLGKTTFSKNCAACHQATGAGIPGAFPPLTDDVAKMGTLEGGMELLIHIALYGLTGSITVNGGTYNGTMPHWSQLSDDEIAAVLNYVLTSWGNQDLLPDNFQLLQPADVTEERGKDLSPVAVHGAREQVLVGE